MDSSALAGINLNNPGQGFAMNLRTRVDPTTASSAQNSGKTGEPSQTGAGDNGDLALGRILFVVNKIANDQQGVLPIIGSPQYSAVGRAVGFTLIGAALNRVA